MLRGNYKTKLIYGGTLLAAFSLTIGSAWAGEIGTDTAPGAQKLQGAQLQCMPNDPAYMSPTGPMGTMQPDQAKLQVCTKCKQAVDDQVKKVDMARNKAIQDNAAVVGAGSAGTSAIGNAATGQQQNTQNNASATNNVGTGAQAQRAAIAKALGQSASTCASQVQSSCNGNLAAIDKKGAEAASQGCNEIASASNANSAEKTASGSTMGDMSQLASALGQALGPLAQMMAGQQQQPDTSSTDPYSSSVPTNTVAGTSLGTSTNPLAGTSIGNSTNPNGTEFKAAKNNITGFTPSAASSFGPSTGYASGSGAGDSSGGGTGVGSGAYSAGGGGGLNSSGASMSPGATDAEKAAAAAAAANAAGENYEVMASGGGGSRPSFLGLKSRTDEDLGAGGESVLGDLGLGEEGSRDLASADELGGGIGEAEGETLFRVIHTKIAEIKKRGSI